MKMSKSEVLSVNTKNDGLLSSQFVMSQILDTAVFFSSSGTAALQAKNEVRTPLCIHDSYFVNDLVFCLPRAICGCEGQNNLLAQ